MTVILFAISFHVALGKVSGNREGINKWMDSFFSVFYFGLQLYIKGILCKRSSPVTANL